MEIPAKHMAQTVYLDTSFVVALALPNDRRHETARIIQSHLDAQDIVVLVSAPVLLEIGNYISRSNTRHLAVEFFNKIKNHPQFKFINLSDNLLSQSMHLYENRADKEWGLVDCVSFVIMEDHNTSIALTADKHFEQAGFIPALLNPDTIVS